MNYQEQTIESQDPGDGWECLINTDKTKDGIMIDGHSYITVVAFDDLDTDRSYAVLKCDKCNYPSVSWTESHRADEMSEGFAYKQTVGGPTE